MLLRHLLSVVLLATASLAQGPNLVQNGDFSKGTSGWTFSGYSVNPKIVKFDTAGMGASASFSCHPGSKRNTLPPGARYEMKQTVQLVQGVPHFLVANIAVYNALNLTNADAGTIEAWADGVLISKVKFGPMRPLRTYRRQICPRFVPKSTGKKELKFVFARAWGARALTPRHHIDDIVLLRTPFPPLLCPRGERKLGASLVVDLYGSKSAAFLLFVAGSLGTGLQVPGFQGSFALPLPPLSVPILAGTLSTQGARRWTLPLPSSLVALAGKPLYWQALEITSSSRGFGTSAAFGIYK